MKRLDPYTKLFEDRIIFLGVQVDDASADDIIAQLIVLESQDPDRDILHVHQLARWLVHRADRDLRHHAVRPSRHRRPSCLGQAASAAAVLLGAGAPGKRFALPNARILIHQPAIAGGDYGQASDIEIQANEVLRMRTWLEETLAMHTGRTLEQVETDIERDKILTAAQAMEYGLIDEVLASRKGSHGLSEPTASADRPAGRRTLSPVGRHAGRPLLAYRAARRRHRRSMEVQRGGSAVPSAAYAGSSGG